MRIAITSLLFFAFFPVFGQYTKYHTTDKRAEKYYEEARQFLKRAQFREAFEPLQDALDKDPNFIEVWLAIGSANYRLGRLDETLVALHKALEIDPDYSKSIYAYFLIGEIYFKQANYEEAKSYLGHYLSRDNTEIQKRKQAEVMVDNCQFALMAMETPFDYNIQVLPDHANSFALQYFPVLSVDQQKIYFTRREGLSVQHDEDIFFSDRQADGGWSVPQSISENINSVYNEGAASLSADGRMLVFTSCDGRRGYGSCDIYVSYKEGNNWSEPENMGNMINSAAWEAQPSLSADGSTVYFVSNRQGGFGRKDIWSSTKNKKGKWGEAVNIGKKINTNKDEISPFIHANGESIYYSSNGNIGLGGLDIYMSEKTDSLWSEPVNLGYPLNDAHDQVSLYISSDGEKGYYTIEKKDRGSFESKLYSFDLPDSFQVSSKSSYLKGTVTDAETGSPLSAEIKLYKLDNEKFYSELSSDKESGEYTVVLSEKNQYGLYVSSKGYLFQDFSFSFDEIKVFDSNLLDIKLEPVKIGATTVLGNIFFDFNEYTLQRSSMSELKEVYDFLKQNPNVKVEISGHTDNVGTAAYNLELSTKRAKSVYDFLLFKRIRAEQISYVGYGHAHPVAPNDNLENQSMNRRIEFKISEISN
ncbi:Tetratricopeptide repeat-containing protein [Reichenbachiella faecimaris]|uniref:Tetratricopeptide repeat-containing protein n=1 Tax=Reichenbachiella faecimaris TaxID=692418 RepID=A0A1W2GKM6_REIFA|nr:OmpA family protein [Reichenbachiella faecimaris]SMD36898.1 Tetratricopeptide repeat-containing protein [Reichenbachiella faecimaris]